MLTSKKALQFDVAAIFIILLVTLAILVGLAILFSDKIYEIVDFIHF